MRDKFVGDVGDFGKYGLLRALCGEDLRLGVVWYFVRDRMLDYLNEPNRFQACDQELFEVLKGIVGSCQRTTTSIEASGLFARSTVFFKQEVPPQAEERRAWAKRALEETGHCEVVFFDPDNGLKDGDLPERGLSSKYIYAAELGPFAARGQSLIVYHHLGRIKREEVKAEVKSRAAGLRKHLGIARDVWALVWHPYAPRAYFIIPNGRSNELRSRIQAMLDGPWGQARPEGPHFEPILLP